MTCRGVLKVVRAVVLFALSFTLLGAGVLVLAQNNFQQQERKDLQNEHRFTALESATAAMMTDIKGIKEDVSQINKYGVGILIGIAALLGETGLRITGVKIFKREDSND